MTTPAGFLGYILPQIFVMCAVVVALCDLAKRACKLDDLLAFCAAALALGTLGYLSFWIAYANYAVFGVVKIVVLVALLAHFGLMAWQRRLSGYRWLVEPLLFASLFFVIVTMLGLSDGGFADPTTTAQHRFSHALPTDNQIPLIVAEALKTGNVPSPLFADWLLSDRPPLQAGLYLLLVLQSGRAGYQVVASWLQATFLFGVWALVVGAGLSSGSRRLTLLACCLLPTALINTFYVWPKMLAAGYLTITFALLFCRSADTERRAQGILIGGFAALAMLSHGTSTFALLGFAAAVVAFWAWPPLKAMLYGAATALALYLPWMLFQNFVDPPGNRLLKWHFAGVIDVDGRSFLATLRDSYGGLSWHDYVLGRIANVGAIIGPWPDSLRDLVSLSPSSAALLRNLDFFNLLPSLHGFALAVIVAIAALPFLPPTQRAIALRMLVAIVVTLAASAILMFVPGSAVNHQGTYATQVLATVFAFMVLGSLAPRLAWLFIAVQGATVAMLYAFTLKHDPALWPLLVICAAATVTLVAYSLAPRFAR